MISNGEGEGEVYDFIEYCGVTLIRLKELFKKRVIFNSEGKQAAHSMEFFNDRLRQTQFQLP